MRREVGRERDGEAEGVWNKDQEGGLHGRGQGRKWKMRF